LPPSSFYQLYFSGPHHLKKNQKIKKKGHMRQKVKRAARPARKTWPGGFARLLINA
jgi:hypothetical protein